MSEQEQEIPEGAAVFPEIPEELGVHPLLLCALHSLVFLSGSSESIVHPAAADEAMDYLSRYLERLTGAEQQRAREDMDCILRYARQEKWDRSSIETLEAINEIWDSEDASL